MHSNPDIFDVTVDDFDQRVLEVSHTTPVMVDFWAEWCSPCLVLSPILEKIMQEYKGRVLLGKVEVDDNMKLAGRYQTRGFPTVILFRDGEEVERFSGAKPLHVIREFLDRNLGVD